MSYLGFRLDIASRLIPGQLPFYKWVYARINANHKHIVIRLSKLKDSEAAGPRHQRVQKPTYHGKKVTRLGLSPAHLIRKKLKRQTI